MEILNSHITEGRDLEVSNDGKYTVTGNGTFDVLMEAVNIHLGAQYDLGRITGPHYSEVYLGAMQEAMQQAILFQLSRQKAGKEVELIEEEMAVKREQLHATNIKVVAELIKQFGFDSSIDDDDKVVLGENASNGLIDEQINQIVSTVEIANIQSDNDTSVKYAQVNKMETEVELLVQKRITEYAQTCQTSSITPASTSVLGAQIHLVGEQAKGFYWNAQTAHYKATLDAGAIHSNIDDAGSTAVINAATQAANNGHWPSP